MTAFEVFAPRHVLVLGGEVGAQRVTWTRFHDEWCGGSTRRVREARRKGLLHSVHSIDFDPVERRWRVDRDCVGRDVLVVGPRVCLLHSVRDDSDRCMEAQLADLFGDKVWVAREAASAASALSERMGADLERLTL